MSAATMLVEELSRAGVSLRREGEQLILEGPEPLITDAVVANVRTHKTDILEALVQWDEGDWHGFYDERAGMAEFDGGRTRADAEVFAFECCIVEWLNHHPERSDPDRCAWCDKPDRDGHTVVPFGTERRSHTWLHPECWPSWFNHRRHKAAKTLMRTGIGPVRQSDEVGG